MKEPSEKRPTLPAPRRPITVQILATCTPEQALAVFDRLDDLREKIRVRYRGQLQDLLEEQQPSLGPRAPSTTRAARC